MTAPIPETQPEQSAPVSYGKKKKILSAIFNMAVGAGATALAKTAVVTAMIGCPPLAILLATSLAVGAAMTAVCHEGKRYKAKKASDSAPCYFSRQNVKDIFNRQNAKDFFNRQNARVFAKSTFFALVGGAIFLGFHEGVIQDTFHKLFGSTPAPAAPLPAVVTTPVHVPVVVPDAVAPLAAVSCPSPLDHFTSVIGDHAVSDRVQDALHRAASTDPKVAAQATKDLAYFSFNGFDGVPKDPSVALELFQKAADAGNVQAKIDMLYIQFHGLGGVHANPQAAIDAMQQIHTPRADMFMEKWGEMGRHAKHAVNFDSKVILSGVKLCAAA